MTTSRLHLAAAALTALMAAQTAAAQADTEPWALTDGMEWNMLSLPHTAARPDAGADKRLQSQYAHAIGVCFDGTAGDGTTHTFDDGSLVWTIGLHSAGALSLSADVELDADGCIVVYSLADIGRFDVYTRADIQADGRIHTLPVPGDAIIVEYQGRTGDRLPAITNVNHDFVGILKVGNVGDSGSCEVDASCLDATADIGQSVCRILSGNRYGTGTLVNNALADGKAYVLTAAHVIADTVSFSCTALFGFSIPRCMTGVSAGKDLSVQGGTLVAYYSTLDVALIELSAAPPAMAVPYWSGWDISPDEVPAPPYVAIHHPYGDTRKASTATATITATTYDSQTNDGKQMAADNHWRVSRWETATTEAGSSGCGLWSNGLLVGTLSGGLATCSNPCNDYFARLRTVWDKSNGHFRPIADFLDPNRTGATRMTGAYLGTTDVEMTNIPLQAAPENGHRELPMRGFVGGHNSLGTTAVAERFESQSTISVSGLSIIPVKTRSTSTQTFRIKLWTDNGGVPGYELASATASVKSLAAKMPESIAFDAPVDVRGSFFAGFEIEYDDSGVDTVATMLLTDAEADNARFRTGGQWQTYAQLTGSQQSASACISLAARTASGSSVTGAPTVQAAVFPRMARSGFDVAAQGLRSVDVFDIEGRRVAHAEADGTGSIRIGCDGWRTGIYVVSAHTCDGTSNVKIIKQ